MGRDRILNVVLVVVTFVWALSFAADVAVPNYQPPPEIHSVFMAIVGGVFVAGSATGNGRSENTNTDERSGRNSEPDQTEEQP